MGLWGSRGDISQKVRPALSCFLPFTLGRTHRSAYHNRRDRDKLREGLVWGKTESPHKLLVAEIFTARSFLPCKRATDIGLREEGPMGKWEGPPRQSNSK